MKIAVNGTSGFIGGELCRFFRAQGHEIAVIPRAAYADKDALKDLISGCDAVINLAGASIAARWSEAYKKQLHASRIETTRALVGAINALENPPFFISASAVGIYENGLEHDESSVKFDRGFLGELACEWESQAAKARTRTAIFRLGVVLGRGGALAKMLPAFRLGLGGKLGSGEQAFCWIHIADLLEAFKFTLQNRQSGVFNLVSPTPNTNGEFTQILSKVLGRPTFFKVPKFALNLMFGEGSVVLLEGAKVYPKALIKSGFDFKFSDLKTALEDVLG
nr:TIGR01777 family oxidoreductase [uncultured Campylobacter sp.]